MNITDIFGFNNLIRAGRSVFLMYPQTSQDATDDDLNTLDFVSYLTLPAGGVYPEFGDVYEGFLPFSTGNIITGSVQMASERIRRFVTPIDVSGNGQVQTRHHIPNNPFDFGTGADSNGRVSYYQFFRPPGIPSVAMHIPSGAVQPSPTYPFFSWAEPPTMFAPNVGTGNLNYPNPNFDTTNNVYIGDLTNNRYHGYEHYRNPQPFGLTDPSTAPFGDQALFAPMPYDNGGSLVIPSWIGPINSSPLATAPVLAQGTLPPYFGLPYNPAYQALIMNSSNNPTFTVNNYPLGSLARDQADEMNLYRPNGSDSPFGPSDLEWLYRTQDVDGASLHSRLSQLAPISFLNPNEGLTPAHVGGLDLGHGQFRLRARQSRQ